MTRGSLRSLARDLGRINNATADSVLDNYLNRAAAKFAGDTLLLVKRLAISMRPHFWLGTTEAFKLTVHTALGGYLINGTDIVLSAVKNFSLGSTIASALQTKIQAAGAAATTITFDEDTRIFTINGSAETPTIDYIKIEPPGSATYNDASYKLFGIAIEETQSAEAFLGDAAPHCMQEVQLPSDFSRVDEMVFDEHWDDPLQPEIFRKRDYGEGATPSWYSIYDRHDGRKYAVLTPENVEVGARVDLAYNYIPSSIATGSSGDSSSFGFPDNFEDAIAFWACYLQRVSEGEMTEALEYRALYQDLADEAACARDSQVGGGYSMVTRGRTGL